MKILKLILISNLIIHSFVTWSKEVVSDPSSHSIMSQWFSIDSSFDNKFEKTLLSEDDNIAKYSLSFISDDRQPVNGILAVPKNKSESLKLALLLHAMGTDQNLWWNPNKISGSKISEKLLQQGYAVLTLDARRHGKRVSDGLGPKDMIAKAHSEQPRLYTDMIIGTVRDYRIALEWAQKELHLENTSILVAGYSMGAQMSLLLASYESEINQVMVMVPPFVNESQSPVAPRLHVSRINEAELIILAARQDPYSTQENYELVFNKISTPKKSIKWFDSGHLLPADYFETALNFIDKLSI
jgi:dienelactone hydrolase